MEWHYSQASVTSPKVKEDLITIILWILKFLSHVQHNNVMFCMFHLITRRCCSNSWGTFSYPKVKANRFRAVWERFCAQWRSLVCYTAASTSHPPLSLYSGSWNKTAAASVSIQWPQSGPGISAGDESLSSLNNKIEIVIKHSVSWQTHQKAERSVKPFKAGTICSLSVPAILPCADSQCCTSFKDSVSK